MNANLDRTNCRISLALFPLISTPVNQEPLPKERVGWDFTWLLYYGFVTIIDAISFSFCNSNITCTYYIFVRYELFRWVDEQLC